MVNYHPIAGHRDSYNLATQDTPGSTSERPKIVLKKGLRFLKLWIHIVALSTTAAVVGVNFATVSGWHQGSLSIPDNQVNNLLQFAAEIHEILIVGSLTSIVMHHIRKRLFSCRGLSFRLLGSGNQVSLVGFLFSKGFRSATDRMLILTLAATIIHHH